MTTPTKIWTRWNGSKVPVPLMSDEHIQNAYRRVCEIVLATENKEWWDKRGADLSVCASGSNGHEAKSPCTYENAKAFKQHFEDEAKKRKIRLPVITIQNYRETFATRQDKRFFSAQKFKKTINPQDFI